MRTLLLLGLILVSTPVFAEEVPADVETARSRLQELLEGKKYSEALRFADAATSAHPGDADLHYRYGILLGAVNDRKKAIAELEAAERLLPSEPSVLGDLVLAYYNGDNELAARETAEKLVKVDATNETAKHVLAELDARDRIRARKQPAVAAGSPQALVHEAFSEAAAGHVEATIERYVDPEIFAEISRTTGERDPAEVRRGFIRGFEKSASKNLGELVGFEVQPEATISGATAEVTVRLLIRQTPTRETVDQQLRLIESPLGAKALPPDAREMILALEPADRRAMFERQIGVPRTTITAGTVKLTSSATSWKIADIAIETGGTPLSLRDTLVSHSDDLLAIAGPTKHDNDPMNDRAYRLGYGVGKLLGILAVVGLGIWLIRRRRS